jgi:hypothetical protein
VLDHLKVPTPPRLEVSRDGGPRVEDELKDLVKAKLGLTIGGFTVTPEVSLREDGDAIIIDGKVLEKPFVEKPVSGEDHNVYIYFKGGGGRRLFRKAGHFHSANTAQLTLSRLETNPATSTRLSIIPEPMDLTLTNNLSTLTTQKTLKSTPLARNTPMQRPESHPLSTVLCGATQMERRYGMTIQIQARDMN